jgi:ABC-type glycerol-3-phosphate transport system substrate-binding protein
VQWYSKISDTFGENRDKIGIASPPLGPDKNTGYITYDLCCLALIKGAIAPEMGWLFIDALASAQNMKDMAQKKLGLPSVESAYYNKVFVEFDTEANDIMKKFILAKRKNNELKSLREAEKL